MRQVHRRVQGRDLDFPVPEIACRNCKCLRDGNYDPTPKWIDHAQDIAHHVGLRMHSG